MWNLQPPVNRDSVDVDEDFQTVVAADGAGGRADDRTGSALRGDRPNRRHSRSAGRWSIASCSRSPGPADPRPGDWPESNAAGRRRPWRGNRLRKTRSTPARPPRRRRCEPLWSSCCSLRREGRHERRAAARRCASVSDHCFRQCSRPSAQPGEAAAPTPKPGSGATAALISYGQRWTFHCIFVPANHKVAPVSAMRTAISANRVLFTGPTRTCLIAEAA